MNIILLRHGEAEDLTSQNEDYNRALTAKGKKQLEQVSKYLIRSDYKIDRIATSPLRRAVETAEIVAEHLGIEPEKWVELSPNSDLRNLESKIWANSMHSTILLVGHEPMLSSFICLLIEAGPRTRIVLKKSGLAFVNITSSKLNLTGELTLLINPKIARKI